MTSDPIGHLQSKVQPPSLPEAFVPRPRLLGRLTAALSRRLTLVAGPPGSGKSTLVSHWLQQTEIRASWLNLDDADNQLATFVAHLVWATQTQFPEALPTTQLILQLPDPPSASFIRATLINELADLPDSLVLVLDNFHLTHEPDIIRLVQLLVDYQPDTIRLFLLARGEPQLPLARLQAREQIAEIGPTDIAFTLDEAQSYLNLVTGQEIAQETAVFLTEQTEGWVMGLQLAALALQERETDNGASRYPAVRDDYGYVDYFSKNILAAHSPPHQRLLLVSAIPQVFTPSLCDALLADEQTQPQSSGRLEHLQQSGAFLFPDKSRPGWYRLHRLFREALSRLGKAKFDPLTLAQLHNRASAWFAANDYVEEAVEHALAADNLKAAASVVTARIPGALQREEFATLGRWLDLLPPALIERHPSLLVGKAWHLHLRDHRAPIKSLLTAAELLLEQGQRPEDVATSRSLSGEISTLRSSYHFWHNRRKLARTLADKALAQLPADHPAAYRALCYRALARQSSGDRDEAAQELKRTLQSRLGGSDANLSPLLLAAAHLSLYAVQPEQLLSAANNLISYGSRLQLPLTIAWGHYFLGRLHYQRNRLDLAEEHFSMLVEEEPPFSRDIHGDTLLALALIREANQDTELVAETVATLAALGATHKAQADAFTARQALRQGDTEAAILWVEKTPIPEASAYLFTIDSPLFTRIRVLLAMNTRDRAQEAIHLLLPALKVAKSAGNTLHVAKVLALRALALRTLGRTDTALELLDRSVTLAHGAMVRTFVELGPPMAELLYEMVQKKNDPDGYAVQLLEAFTARDGTIHPLVAAANEKLIEPLTERELEVLQMLYHRLSNVAIAEALEISPLTVKKHTIHIYQKLNVQTRQEAVFAGSQLGLIFDLG